MNISSAAYCVGRAALRLCLLKLGARIVLLGSGLKTLPLSSDLRGETITLQTYAQGRRDAVSTTFTYQANHLTSLRPVHIRHKFVSEDLHISWIRQTRFGGDDWASVSIPLAEESESYVVEIVDAEKVVLSRKVRASNCLFSSADLVGISTTAILRISQLSSVVGAGAAIAVNLYP